MYYRSKIKVPGKTMLFSAFLMTAFLALFSLKAHSQDPYYHVIQAEAKKGGSINPSGDVYVLTQQQYNL